jgi:pyridoxamine 5'-phosphate oxidase
MSEPLLDLEEIRNEFVTKGFREEDLDPDPVVLFARWYQLVLALPIRLPDAMTLATASADGRPSARMVLLKGYDHRGFAFFTNYESRKGLEVAVNPHAALVLYWKELDRQVRIEGRVERTSDEESDAYFASRPWGSRVAATISQQSNRIANRISLDENFRMVASAHPDEQIPRPPTWGGFRVIPATIEFWQGRLNRLHDRFLYTREPDNTWRIERLCP